MAISTTSSTATPTPAVTPTPTAASVTKNAAQSLLTSLNAGSGIDTASLVPSLVEAQFAAKTAQLTAKSNTITTQISGLSALKSAISGFASAYSALVKGGTLTSQPTSSNAALGVSALAGAKVAGLSSTISVNQLAGAQTIRTTATGVDRTDKVGTGKFTLQFGTASYVESTVDDRKRTDIKGFTPAGQAVEISVDGADLDGVAAAINAKGAGITASVVTDANGDAFLSIKGPTGASQAFTLTATEDSDPGLAAYNIGPGATNTSVTATAQNARLTVDGIAVERASNTINNLVPGVKLQLNTVSDKPVTLGSTTPTAALSQAMSDIVETYNEVLSTLTEQTNPMTGVLRGDTAAQSLLRSLKTLTLTPLSTGATAGAPTTLAQIGVATNRDGTLRLDSAALSSALLTNAGAIETMLNGSADGKAGLGAVLASFAAAATSTTTGLGASQTRYTAAQSAILDAKAKIADQSDAMTTRLTQQFSSMNSRVSSYKSIQTFLTNQIAAWNKSDS